jgi:UDP-glucose 4-epimerase
VIDTARAVTGREIPVVYGERRAGDPPRLVADSGKARQVLGWKPKYSDLATMIEHAWRWEQRLAGDEIKI